MDTTTPTPAPARLQWTRSTGRSHSYAFDTELGLKYVVLHGGRFYGALLLVETFDGRGVDSHTAKTTAEAQQMAQDLFAAARP